VPAALASAGLRGSDFITGWKRRDSPLDIGLVDESSMLDERQFDDLTEIFPALVLFGDPGAARAGGPVGRDGVRPVQTGPTAGACTASTGRRPTTRSSIWPMRLAIPDLTFERFERMIEDAAASDDRVRIAPRADSDMMARSPVLVWRNATRIRLITAFRAAHGAPEDQLIPGEPLLCDGIELPLKHRKRRIDLEARGLIKGAPVIYLGPESKDGFSRLHVIGAESPRLSAASIVKIEKPGEEEPFIPFAARMGATFLHGAAVTIHKAQGSQWPEVQVFAPDLYAAARSGRIEAGQALWKRLAYVAITRAEERLIWVTRYMLSKPQAALGDRGPEGARGAAGT
jgi:exodeoxyribonuclease-5